MSRYNEAFPLVEGPRLYIRPWRNEDDMAQRQWPNYSDPLSELWNLPRPIKPGLAFFTFLYHIVGLRRAWAVEDRAHQLIGRISLRDIDHLRQRARLGISLDEPYIGKGFGTEVLTLFLDYYFETLGFTAMVLDVAAFNQRAIRCYERLGFATVSTEWRCAGQAPLEQQLDAESYQVLTPFLRHDRTGFWVAFIEMELHRLQWRNRLFHQTIGNTVATRSEAARGKAV